MSAPELGPEQSSIRIRQKGPVGWLNLGLLFDIGFLAAISAATDNRTARREVLAALDTTSDDCPFFDHSDESAGDVWVDYVADLGDGFAATHSIAWLIGRDFLGIGAAEERIAQPVPPDHRQECVPEDFPGPVLPAGQVLILGGDLVYPFATQREYDDRTIGPYHAARPWQRDAAGQPLGRKLFSIPGNHDWYDGLGAFVQRFCQAGRWMGCWQVQHRRSYFAIRLPHQVWIWGVDLATADDFDAPQLDYFKECASRLQDGDTVILCVPKPAWVDRKRCKGIHTDESKSWQSWNKIDLIAKMVTARARGTDGTQIETRIGAILSGDLHHYSRYLSQGQDDRTHLVTCGGGGAFLLGTAGLPDAVEVGDAREAKLVAAYPDRNISRHLSRQAFKLPWRHWELCTLLGGVMLMLVWYLDTAGSRPILAPGFDGFWAAMVSLITSSPVPLLILSGVFYGFFAFARSGAEGTWWRTLLASLVHMLGQLAVAVLIAGTVKHHLLPLLPDNPALPSFLGLAAVLPVALLLAWAGAGLLFAAYLIASNEILGLHGLEVYSAQSIEDWKGFLRIRVHSRGIAIYPIGLDKVCHDWIPRGATMARQAAEEQARGRAGFGSRLLRAVSSRLGQREDVFADDPRATHLYAPRTALEPNLIEDPIIIPRIGTQT